MDYRRRLSGLQEQMARRGLDLVAYGPSADLQYLSGLSLDWRAEAEADGFEGSLFVPRQGSPVLVLASARADQAGQTWIDDVRVLGEKAGPGTLIRDVLRELGAEAGTAALGQRADACVGEALAGMSGAAEPRDAKGLTDRLRMIKDAEEIERLRRVAGLTGKVLEAVAGQITEGATQGETEAEIEQAGRRLGADGVSFPPAVIFTKSGTEPSDEPFVYPRDEPLTADVSIAFDFGFVKDGYCSDFGRSLYFGDPGESIRGAYEALQQGVLETVARMRDGGMKLSELFPALEKTIDRFGYGDYLRARLPNGVLGHCIGIDVHEDPWINPDCGQTLRAGMVMALEPKLWHSGEYYLRVEDIVLVGESGCEFLTEFDRTAFEL